MEQIKVYNFKRKVFQDYVFTLIFQYTESWCNDED